MSNDDEYINKLFETLSYSNAQFDKNVLFIASGALGVSFAFIEKIVPLKDACDKSTLINAWYLFAIVILISLVNHFISSLSIGWTILNNNKSEVDIKRGRDKWNWFIRILNFLMIVGLGSGVMSLVYFINQNI